MSVLFRFSFFALFAVIVFSFFIIKVVCPPKEPSVTRMPGAVVPEDRPSSRPCSESTSHIVQKGETFASILKALMITPDYSDRIFRALCRAGLVKLYPGDSLVFAYDTGCSLVKLSLLSRLQYWYHAACADSPIIAEQQPLSVTLSCELMNGTLETSLLDAMQQYGLGPYLACRLSDIFAWDINFFLDPRKGDKFQILFSRKYAAGRCIGYGDILAARYISTTGRDYYAIGFRSADSTMLYYDLTGKSVQKQFLKAPLRYLRISSGFTNQRLHPILGIVIPHLGIDYAAPAGTPVYAAADGTVRKTGYDKNNGNHVEIAHGGSYSTCYAHLATISGSIRSGKQVMQGQMIGTVGSTGLATGPHLDYRMKRHSIAVNPLTVNLPSKRGIGRQETEDFNRVKESSLALFNFSFPQGQGHTILDIAQQSVQQYKSPAPTNVIKSGS
jgi:murein DD-endopeptidase MepM/ murein hydrolase activator NlpD